MSLRDRLFNIARSELKSAAKKVRDSAEGLLGGPGSADEAWEEAEAERDRRRQEDAKGRERQPKPGMRDDAKIQRYYANLELPIGASLAEVKAAYRRLMRRYHPDLHQADKDKIAVATKLAQELRTAYEGLLEHLEKTP